MHTHIYNAYIFNSLRAVDALSELSNRDLAIRVRVLRSSPLGNGLLLLVVIKLAPLRVLLHRGVNQGFRLDIVEHAVLV